MRSRDKKALTPNPRLLLISWSSVKALCRNIATGHEITSSGVQKVLTSNQYFLDAAIQTKREPQQPGDFRLKAEATPFPGRRARPGV
jgi:hypothetical protein